MDLFTLTSTPKHLKIASSFPIEEYFFYIPRPS